jgi:hypothetical protein
MIETLNDTAYYFTLNLVLIIEKYPLAIGYLLWILAAWSSSKVMRYIALFFLCWISPRRVKITLAKLAYVYVIAYIRARKEHKNHAEWFAFTHFYRAWVALHTLPKNSHTVSFLHEMGDMPVGTFVDFNGLTLEVGSWKPLFYKHLGVDPKDPTKFRS